MKRDYEPFFSEELEEALDQVNHHLEICCGGVGEQVVEFVNSFKQCDVALLAYVMEAIVAGMKANFTEYDSYVYDFLMLSAESMVIKGPGEENDNGKS